MEIGPAWMEITNRIIDIDWPDLSDARAAEMFAYVKGAHQERVATDIGDIILSEALKGDQGMMTHFLQSLVGKLSKYQPLSTSEAFGLCFVLTRVLKTPRALQVAAGSGSRRGGTRQGAKSLTVALDVIHQLTHGSARSFDDAWAATAEKLHLSESMVKKYWIDRRELVLRTLRSQQDVTAEQIVEQSVEQGFRQA